MEYLKIKNGKFKQITKRACLITLESGEEAIAQLEEAVDLLMSVVNELKALKGSEV